MSFNSEVKRELSRLDWDKKCCMLAEIAGFIRICGSIALAGRGKFKIVLKTDNPPIARRFKQLIKEYFSVETSLEVGDGNGIRKGKTYFIIINPEDRSEEILRETGILMIKEGMNFISDGIYGDLIKKKCCKKAYLRGLFMGSGIINDPEKSYHFEIVSSTEILGKDIVKMINSFKGINCKLAKRRKEFVVYVKDSEQIVDIMAIMGASASLFIYEDVRIKKGIKNRANRINNCDQANIDKAVAASERHIKAIKKIDDNFGIENLPEKLRVVAEIRLANPHVNLGELGEMLSPPLSKSGINKRLMKLDEMAGKIG